MKSEVSQIKINEMNNI